MGMFIGMMVILGVISVIIFIKNKTLDVAGKITQTPLMDAAVDGDVDEIKKLLSSGVDIDETNAAKHTALSLAVIKKNEEAAKMLIDAGAGLTMLYRDDNNIFDLAIESKNENILLHLIEKSDTELLIENYLFTRATKENFSIDVLKKLYEKVEREQKGTYTKISQGKDYSSVDISLYWATKNDNVQNIEFLLGNGAGLSAEPIWWAVANERYPLVKTYIELGDNIEAKGEDGNTCLAIAVKKGNYEIAELLLENKANPNINIKPDNLPLLTYATYGKTKQKTIVRLLKKYGATSKVNFWTGEIKKE